ncbi:MAG TPA: glycosyltransferase family 39 protein [Candidatus Goldiibacteriota bacterium]|nr:glycosyltransferase family 39 protein [Candidatus Goldiibacteriota bacterium]
MVKIGKNTILMFVIFASAAVIAHPVLVSAEPSYKLFLSLIIIYTAAFYAFYDLRVEKAVFFRMIILVAAAGFLGAAQYIFSFFEHKIMPYGAFLMVTGGMAFALMTLLNAKEAGQDAGIKKPDLASVAAVTAAAFIIRYWDLSGLLPGIWFDEAQNGIETMNLLDKGTPEIFIQRYTNMPAMFFYLAAVFVKIFGLGIFPLRLVSCILGTLSVAAFYFLALQVFKNRNYALLAAVLLAFSRWHITFSRVAFLGMQSVLFEILFFYFYLKFMENRRLIYAVIAGALLGLAQYTFSAANFIVVFAAAHIMLMAVREKGSFFREKLYGVCVMAAVSLVAAGPLISYSIKHKGAYFQRAKDVSILREIREDKSFRPILRSMQIYSLVFNFEGDYNGRHNLYKKPILDDFGAAMFIAGLAAALALARYRFMALWFFIMILPGMMTITIEAPQVYRIICAIPAVYLLIVLALKFSAETMELFTGKKAAGLALAGALTVSSAAVNFHQYFFLYPKHEATYMSFSPEANAIGRLINEKYPDYVVLVSTAKNLYGFYMWEQNVISTFLTYNKSRFGYMRSNTGVTLANLAGKKGVLLVTRPSDKDENSAIEAQYGKLLQKKEEYTNKFSGEVMFTAWYIRTQDLSRNENNIVYLKVND